jgi:hypothetical protein
MSVSPQARKADPTLPLFWEARAIETTSRHGKKPILLTSLMDAKAGTTREMQAHRDKRPADQTGHAWQ